MRCQVGKGGHQPHGPQLSLLYQSSPGEINTANAYRNSKGIALMENIPPPEEKFTNPKGNSAMGLPLQNGRLLDGGRAV